MTQKINHQHAAHCETGVMSTMMRHHGVDISEPMAFGLSSSLSFAYLPFIKLNGMPLIGYRMPPRSVIKGLQKRLNFKMQFQTFADQEKGMLALDQLLDQGKIVGLQGSVYWLPFFPESMRFHFNAHNFIAYGKEQEEYLISDPVFEQPVRCEQKALKKSRFAKGALAPKGMLYYPKTLPHALNYQTIIPKAIKKNVRLMTAPVPIAGINGIRFLAKKLNKLQKSGSSVKYNKLFVGHIVRMQEEIGTGGAGFRFLYASFLQEAGEKLNSSQLNDASNQMTIAGDRWRDFALAAVKMCKNKDNTDLTELALQLNSCADTEAQVWKTLKNL